MSSIFEAVAEVFRTRKQKQAGDFSELVRQLADGKGNPGPAEIAELLETGGKTPADLQAAVEYRLKRLEFARRLAELPGLQGEKAELERKGAEENERYRLLVKPLEEQHLQNIATLNGRYRTVAAAIPVAESMRAS